MKKIVTIFVIILLICIFLLITVSNYVIKKHISFYLYENHMPPSFGFDNYSSFTNPDSYATCFINTSREFDARYEIIKIKYLSSPKTFSEYKFDNYTSSGSLRIENVYIDNNLKSKAKVTIRDKKLYIIRQITIPLEIRWAV